MPMLGEIRTFAGNFPPNGWAFCNGQIIPIAQNTYLFAILGTRFGGDGVTTFALPDLRGRVPIGYGQGPGLQSHPQGEAGGAEMHTLAVNELAAHGHALRCASTLGTSDAPSGNVMARNPALIPNYGPTGDVDLAAGMIVASGGGQPHNNMQSYLVLSYIIAITGWTPSYP